MTEIELTSERRALLESVDQLGRSARRRVPLLVLGLVVIVVGLALLWAQLQHQEAARARAETVAAQTARADAESRRDALIELHRQDAAKFKAAQDALGARDFATLADILQVARFEAATQAQALADPPAAPAATPGAPAAPAAMAPLPTASFPQKVYIQFAGLERPSIVALNGALRQAGWKVIGKDGERTSKAAGLNEVRYHGDADKPAAEALAAALTQADVGAKPVRARRMDAIYAGTLEAWISRT